MSDVRVRKLQEFIKQEVSNMLMRGFERSPHRLYYSYRCTSDW